MSTLSKKLVAICLATAFSMVMYGCGGGGGSSSPAPMDDDDDMTMTPIECPDGQEPNASNDACVKTAETLAAEAVAATKAAATKTTEIKAEADQMTDAGLGGSDAPTTTEGAEGEYTLAIKHGETSITVEGATDAADVKFMQTDVSAGTTRHTRTMDADTDGNVVEEVAMVYTDIEAPKATAFAMVRNAAGELTQALDVRKDGGTVSNDDPADSRDVSAAALDGSATADAAILALVMSSEFTSNTAAVLTFGGDDPADEDDAAAEVGGTYNGAMGTYTCAGGATDCTVTLDAMGKITAMSDGWIFTPDEGATSDVPDYEYLHYGFWLKRTTDKDGAVTYNEVETFAGSSVAASGDTSTVTGSATYSGDALGVYVHQVRNPAGNIDSATSGHFTADVMLTATFGQVPVSDTDSTGTIAPNLLNTLSGTINNFDLSGHDEGPSWSVALQGDITESAGTASGTAKGGGDDGDYSATFHGSVAPVAPSTVVPKPHSVIGEFNAFFSNGSVAGAFGARKD